MMTVRATEVFYVSDEQVPSFAGEISRPGWYWWYCRTDQVPDGDACGPYILRRDAEEAAREAQYG